MVVVVVVEVVVVLVESGVVVPSLHFAHAQGQPELNARNFAKFSFQNNPVCVCAGKSTSVTQLRLIQDCSESLFYFVPHTHTGSTSWMLLELKFDIK